jgi:prepilin-type N-terminal cleavage/methylation domain-containing protein
VRAARGRRDGERGVTLIEMLVTIAVMGAGVTAMVGGFAGAERGVAVARAQSALVAALRTASDDVRAAPYRACAGVAAGEGYSVGVPGVAAATTVVRPTAPPTLSSATGPIASAATLCGASGGAMAGAACAAGAAEACDYGIQRVTVSVSSAGRTLSRDVWKGAGT